MRVLLLFIALLHVSQVSTWTERSVSWNRFKLLHNKHYPSLREEQHRRAVFASNVAMIQEHNVKADLGIHSYRLKINQFADMTHEEFVRTMLGGFKMPAQPRRHRGQHVFSSPPNVNIPAAVDWRKHGAVTTVIEEQGQCGSCWAFTATGSLEGQHAIKTGQLVRLSAQNLMDCSGSFGTYGCNGGYMDDAFQYINVNEGIDTEATYPYEAMQGDCRFNRSNVGATDTGFVDIPQGNETALQIAIASAGPIAVAVDGSHSSFQFYASGVYDEPDCSVQSVDHSFVLVGYDTFNNGSTKKDYYIAKNSWGESWGDHGYIWMSRNKDNQCGIANIASYPLV